MATGYQLIDSPAAIGRMIGAMVGVVSIFLAWLIATASVSGSYASIQAASSATSLVDVLKGSETGLIIGGVIFILGAMAALLTYYGWFAELLGMVIFMVSIPAPTVVGGGFINYTMRFGVGIGFGVAIISVVIGALAMLYHKGLLRRP